MLKGEFYGNFNYFVSNLYIVEYALILQIYGKEEVNTKTTYNCYYFGRGAEPMFKKGLNELKSLKVKLFTHTDLDGVGCAVVGNWAFKNSVHVDYCGYHEIDQKVMNFIREGKVEDYDAVFITDISVKKEVADVINDGYGDKFVLIDHHITAYWLNEYDWATVNELENWSPTASERGETVKSSGTSMFYAWLWDNGLLQSINLYEFAETVRKYDTWEWTTKYNEIAPKHLNDLLTIFGRYKFLERFTENCDITLTNTERTVVTLEEKRIERYVKAKQSELVTLERDGYTFGVVFAEQYHSELGNKLAIDNPDLDFITMINPSRKTISYRGIKVNINLGEYAKTRGGGGHPQASGSPISDEVIENFIQSVFP